MKILMSALACEPGKGSELEVGFRAMLAAASLHDVWVLTNNHTLPAVRQAIEGLPEQHRIHLEGIDFGVGAEGIALLTVPGFHFYYDKWQRRAAARAVELDRLVDFDVVHHVTLAAYWTRTGVAVLDKPLVWGPVGGGVEAPLPLLRELGWRGLLEDAGRILTRRVLARFGPARRAQRRAAVTFAQNQATLEKIRSRGTVSVMTNATVISPGEVAHQHGRTADVLFVGRLVAWKGPMLALRTFRHVRNGRARLIFCGEGYERVRMERAAKRWGIADRVCFEGWLPREQLLARLATAGSLLHPALHEEAGLCVAEALALGTPVVCLDHGGPAEIVRQWPQTPSVAVSPASPETAARRLADAIDGFLDAPPPLISTPRASRTEFAPQLLEAYALAAQVTRRGRLGNHVWAFPRGKPQLFANSPRALSKGVLMYAFGRRIPRLVQTGIALQVRIPGLRRLVTERHSEVEPVCGWDVWANIAEELRRRHAETSGEWLHLSSQWQKQRSNVIALNRAGEPQFFLVVEPTATHARGPLIPVTSFRVPRCIDSFQIGDWSIRQCETLPQFHRPALWHPTRIGTVADDIPVALSQAVERSADIAPHWQRIHGDLVPWNLREDDRGQLWLVDWEDAAWGPPLADLVRFIVAHESLQWRSPAAIAAFVRSAVSAERAEGLLEVGKFWLGHRNLRAIQNSEGWSRTKNRDMARAAREAAAFRVLAGQTDGREHIEADTSHRNQEAGRQA